MGRVVMLATKVEEHTGDPLEIELLALFWVLQLCFLRIQRFVVESDSILAIQAMEQGESSCAQYSNLIQELKHLQHCFMNCTFQYLSWVGNNMGIKTCSVCVSSRGYSYLVRFCPEFHFISIMGRCKSVVCNVFFS